MSMCEDGLVKDAFPKGDMPYRHWLSREWSSKGATALVIGINPNSATHCKEDGMTRFLVETLSKLTGRFTCRKYILVNCCDLRERDPTKLLFAKTPSSPKNFDTIRRMLAKSDFVVASWGTTDYGPVVNEFRGKVAALLRVSGKDILCFSPKGHPIYCSRRNKNSRDSRWSSKPVPWSG